MGNYQDLVEYLLEKKLISVDSLVSGDLLLFSNQNRHLNYKVVQHEYNSLFVKCCISYDEQAHQTFLQEGLWYEAANREIKFESIIKYLPKFFLFDHTQKILVLESILDSVSLREFHNQNGSFPPIVAKSVAEALVDLHKLESNSKYERDNIPWILSPDIHSRLFESEMHSAISELLDIVSQDEEFRFLLNSLRKEWQATHIIHCDLKWDNILVSTDSYKTNSCSIKLIDWESVCVGDPAWDIAGMFHAYLAYWIWSMPLNYDVNASELAELAGFPIENMQPAITSFWEAYQLRVKDDSTAPMLLSRSTAYCASRLIQTAYESTFQSRNLTQQTIYLIQLALNILKDPIGAARSLLGISLYENGYE